MEQVHFVDHRQDGIIGLMNWPLEEIREGAVSPREGADAAKDIADSAEDQYERYKED
jgi:hypothetical protein